MLSVLLRCSAPAVVALSCLVVAALGSAEGTGCRPPTPAEQAWMDDNLVIPDLVRPNRTAVERLNAERRAAGMPELALVPVADEHAVVGRTARVRAAAPAAAIALAPAAPAPLPTTVDNSLLDAFPPIGDQGGLGSCACYSTTYYTMTYMIARARGIDAKNGGNSTRFSPKFCYNLLNNGIDDGSWITTAYAVQQNHGVPSLAAWPYDGDFLAWPTSAAVWRDAIPNRMGSSGAIYGVNTAQGLLDLKRMLANGHVLNFAMDIFGWQYATLGNDPATSADDAYAGQAICHWAQDDDIGHAMTVVGYNDNLWVDLNGNGTVEAGEKGALRIVNNWGTGWKNAGSVWLSYDALKSSSAVGGWSGGSDRVNAWWFNAAYWISARPIHQPTVLGQFTVSTAHRSQLSLQLGLSSTATTSPTTMLNSSLQGAGGAFAFDGTTTAGAATVVLDFTDLLTAGSTRCYLKAYDSVSGGPCAVQSFALTDAAGTVLASASGTSPAGGLPQSADAGTVLAWADATTSDSVAPAAIGDLAITGVTSTAIALGWTASGDDGASGIATSYELRYATTAITAGTWPTATLAGSLPAPQLSGSSDGFVLSGLTAGVTYHIAVIAIDDAGNAGALSNVVSDRTPNPPTITSPLSATTIVGTAFSYQITAAANPTSFGASGLPLGLSCSPSGLISGIPSALGTSPVTLTASNATDSSTATLLLTVNASASATPAAMPAAAQGGGGGGGCGAGGLSGLLISALALVALRRRSRD